MLFFRLIIHIDNEKSNDSRMKDIILYNVKIKSILFRVKLANIDICLRNIISKHDISDVANKTGGLFFILALQNYRNICAEILQVFITAIYLFSLIDNHKLIYRENNKLSILIFRFNLFKLY